MPRFVNAQVLVASAVTLLLGFGPGLGYSHLGNGHRHAQARAGGLGLPRAPRCPARASAVPAGVAITLTASSSFDRDCYYAPAGQRFTISLTNPVFTLDGHSPTYARLVVSPSRHPALRPTRQRGLWVGSSATAVFTSKPVRAPATRVFTVRPLPAGTYDLQLLDGRPNVIATLVVH